jgi:hypothetical protein
MGDYTPVNSDAAAFTSTASATVTGGQLVKVSGSGTVAPVAATTDRAIGVAAFDAANGQRLTVYVLPGMIHEVLNVNAGTITAGAAVTAGATGGADTGTLATVAAAGTLIGIALTTAATGVKVRFIGV